VLLFVYHLISLTDFLPLADVKTLVGWSMIGSIALNICINFSIILRDSTKLTIRDAKHRYVKYIHSRALKRLESYLDESASNKITEVLPTVANENFQQKTKKNKRPQVVDRLVSITSSESNSSSDSSSSEEEELKID